MANESMTSLLSRLEALTGSSRELDLAISVAINYRGVFDPAFEWKWSVFADEIDGYVDGKCKAHLDPCQFIPRWTESIDAALTLIPKLAGWKLSSWFKDGYAADMHSNGLITRAEAHSPAIALVIACLKAKEASKP